MTEFHELGVSLQASNPQWLDDTWDENLTDSVQAYSHVIQANGGYWSANMSLRGDLSVAEWWLQNGLGAHIELFDDVLEKCFVGAANRITINIGPLSVIRGPLLSTANRVDLYYSTVDTSVDPPAVGVRENVGDTDDTDSQDRWGIYPKILSIGGATEDDAEQIRDTYLEEHKLPIVSQTWNSQSQSQISISIEAVGYIQFLMYPYNQTTSGGDITCTAKIEAIIADNPNIAWLAIDTENIDTNSVEVAQWEDNNKLAWALIKEIVARGGSSNERWLFALYNDFRAYYNAAPTTTEYQQRLSDTDRRVSTMEGGWVAPWNVRPGKWLEFPDFLVGYQTPTDRRVDPRLMFIETVNYTAPFGLQLTGGKFETLPQLLASKGLAGVGA